MTLPSGGDRRHSSTTNRPQLTSAPRATLSSAVFWKPAFTPFLRCVARPPFEVYTVAGTSTECVYPNSHGLVPNGSSDKHKRKRTSVGVRDLRFFLVTRQALVSPIACSMRLAGGTSAVKTLLLPPSSPNNPRISRRSYKNWS